jgi:hypothetical protein
MTDLNLNPDPRSTWGASRAYRDAWNAEYGTKVEDGSGLSAPVEETEVVEPVVTKPTPSTIFNRD